MLRIHESYDCDNCTCYDLEMAKIIRKKNGKRKLVWVHIAPCDWHGRIKKTDPTNYFIERNGEPIGEMNLRCIGMITHPTDYPPDACIMQKFEFGKSRKRAFKSFITKNKLGDPLWTAYYKAGFKKGAYL